jgi:hypothetical protein
LAPRERANKGERTRRIRVGGMGAREMEATLSVVLAGQRSGDGSIAGLEMKGRVWLGQVGPSGQAAWACFREKQRE